MAGRDTKTRYQGVYARHQYGCAKTADNAARCTCEPSYFGVAWDKRMARTRKTKHHPRITEARNARAELVASLREGRPVGASGIRIEAASERFVEAARQGIALNKHGRRYKRSAIVDLDSSLGKLPDSIQHRRLDELTRGEIQAAVDDFRRDALSGSRIRSIVNALRSLYRWAQDREYVEHDPAALVRLPALESKPRDRVATPAEFARLLGALGDVDALPFALAAYGTARAGEIRWLSWDDVDLKHQAMRLTAEEGGKSAASQRIVPLVRPLRQRLRAAWIKQGRPKSGRVCPPRRSSASGMIALGTLTKRVHKTWTEAKLEPIGLHESRHTAATWLDHAGISPKVASQLMGHATPEHQPGAASITLSRYTHVLTGELERARDQLDEFLVQRERAEAVSE